MAAKTYTVEKFNVAQQVSATDLDALLADPEFHAVWWEMFEYGFRQRLEDNRGEPVTPWDWSVGPVHWEGEDEETGEPYTYDGYLIVGTCRAMRSA